MGNDFFSSNKKLGILGGGQLGKMLLWETSKFDIHTKVMDASAQAPSRFGCNEFIQGDILDYDSVLDFAKDLDVLTIEIENVSVEALEFLSNNGLKVYPQPNILRTIQNKCTQKAFYQQNGIPTSNFKNYETIDALKVDIEKGDRALPFVWKAARFGYDGQGVKIVRKVADIENLPKVECLAEELVPFKNELAVTVGRSSQGEIKTYPTVEMEFHPEANQVEFVLCPARITPEIEQKAQELAKKVSAAFGHVGLLAVEMFLTENDEILVNEVAPRPHNSGHYTIEGSFTSQFEQHLRCILDLPLGNTKSKTAAVMANLVGAQGHTGQVFYKNMDRLLEFPGVTPHIYGKKETRPFRKMGHITAVHEDLETARYWAKKAKETVTVICHP